MTARRECVPSRHKNNLPVVLHVEVGVSQDKLLRIYYEECEENMALLEKGALGLEDSSDPELLNTVFRAVHSIKGGAAHFGLAEVASFSHSLEEMLDMMRGGKARVPGDGVNLILDGGDCLRQMLAVSRGEGAVDTSALAETLRRIKAYIAAEPAEVKTGPARPSEALGRFRVVYRPNPLCIHRGESPLEALRNISDRFKVERIEARCDNLPMLARMSHDICYIWWEITISSDMEYDCFQRTLAGLVGGSLEISALTDDKQPHSVFFDQPPSLLGSILLKEGMVSEDQLSQAISRQNPPVKLGEVLVNDKAITSSQLKGVLDKQKAASGNIEGAIVRVDTTKLDKLVNLAGELVITRSLFAQPAISAGLELVPGFSDAVARLERHSHDLQETALALRMVPLGNIVNRFPRMVRDLATGFGKKVSLLITGEATELDKGLMEKLADPLTHLIRNAVAHGMEMPEERRAAGKPDGGTIRLRLCEEAGSVVITVEDDGRGLDRDAILRKAAESGLFKVANKSTPDEWANEWAYDLIFMPGFSTAESVDRVSGRGVGLDVVKKNIEGLGGTIGVVSSPGAFTRFVLRLPLTVAIIDGQLIRVGDELYVLPLTSIIETKRPDASEIRTVQGQGEVMLWRDKCVPFVRLYSALNGEAWETDPSNALVIVVDAGGRYLALMVDELLEQQQMVVKGLGGTLARTPGIAGATILGDGKVALILDVSTLEKPVHLH